MVIILDYTVQQLEKALPFTKGQWKPYSPPVISMDDIKEGGIVDLTKDVDKWKWSFPLEDKIKTRNI